MWRDPYQLRTPCGDGVTLRVTKLNDMVSDEEGSYTKGLRGFTDQGPYLLKPLWYNTTNCTGSQGFLFYGFLMSCEPLHKSFKVAKRLYEYKSKFPPSDNSLARPNGNSFSGELWGSFVFSISSFLPIFSP